MLHASITLETPENLGALWSLSGASEDGREHLVLLFFVRGSLKKGKGSSIRHHLC